MTSHQDSNAVTTSKAKKNRFLLWLHWIRMIVKICEDGELQASPLGVRGGFSFACPACPLGKQPGFLHFQSISNAQYLTHTARMRLPLRQLPRHVLRTLIFFHWHSPHIHSFNVLSNTIEVLLRPSNGPNEKGMLSA